MTWQKAAIKIQQDLFCDTSTFHSLKNSLMKLYAVQTVKLLYSALRVYLYCTPAMKQRHTTASLRAFQILAFYLWALSTGQKRAPCLLKRVEAFSSSKLKV